MKKNKKKTVKEQLSEIYEMVGFFAAAGHTADVTDDEDLAMIMFCNDVRDRIIELEDDLNFDYFKDERVEVDMEKELEKLGIKKTRRG